MTASELIALTRPEDLFPGDFEKAKQLYRQLSKRWHPDVKDGNVAVFTHVSDLYHKAVDKLTRGVWEGSAVLKLTDVNGVEHAITIRASAKMDFGQSLVGDHHVVYLIEPTYTAMALQSDWSKKYRFANDRMKTEYLRYLPQHPTATYLHDGRLMIQIDKTPDLLRLRDVVTHVGVLEQRHVAWIVSTMLNLACYLSYADIVHHDISPDTYFISPQYHSGALLGGWWHARVRGTTIDSVPVRTYNFLPFKVRVNKCASTQTDLELIRATARECLPSGKSDPMRKWLNEPGSGSAVEQYKQWQEVLKQTFGERKFVKLPVDADTVYGSTTAKVV